MQYLQPLSSIEEHWACDLNYKQGVLELPSI
jgi:hypothetical protein